MFETKDGTLAPRVATRSRWCLLPRAALLLLASVALGGLLTPCFADEGPKPDPAGTATGDRTTTYDAAGNPFGSCSRPKRAGLCPEKERVRRVYGAAGEGAPRIQLSRTRGPGCDRPDPRRHAAIPLSIDGCDRVRGLGLRRHLRGVRRGKQNQEHAGLDRGRTGRAGCS
jgi:hypothetical protein